MYTCSDRKFQSAQVPAYISIKTDLIFIKHNLK